MSRTYHILHKHGISISGDFLCVIGIQEDKICTLPINLLPEELGITAVDRLYPLKPKKPV